MSWTRCPRSMFYRETVKIGRFDKRAESFDRAYVDPIDLVLVRTIPWRGTHVQVLHWRIVVLDRRAFDNLDDETAGILTAWSERVVGYMGLDELDSKAATRHKEILLADLEVDLHSRDLLLDAIELLVNVSPPNATSFLQKKVPRGDRAVEDALAYLGVKC